MANPQLINDKRRFLLTAALPYANGPLHIGHMAGVYIPADIFARYQRLKGNDVAFICGSDEHGVAVTLKAMKEGLTTQQTVDKYHQIIKQSFEDFGISFDHYSRTSSVVHHQTASEFFKKLHDANQLTTLESEQFFDPVANQFLADRFIQGTCPICGYEHAYGDQCENCGSTLSPQELKNPRSMLSGQAPILKATSHWYLPLDKWEDWLKSYILEGHKDDWKSNVYGQCKSWIDQGLKPRAVTRDLDWGVKLPLPDTEGKVLYVWFDAPIGYISATKEWAEQKNKQWEDYWKNPSTELVHFIGKDNIVFHCIIFPVMLKAHGNFKYADQVPANEFLNLEGQKISTSRNWAVWLHEYLQDLPEKQDVLRYVLTANAPETKDNDFTWKDFQARNNNELLAILGNFVNRILVLSHKYYNGVVPPAEELLPEDLSLFKEIEGFPKRIADSLEKYRFREALGEYMDLARLGNKYLTEQEPWKLQKTNPDRVRTVMYCALQVVANLAVLGEPFLPFTSAKIRQMVPFQGKDLGWAAGGKTDLVTAGTLLNQPVLLFEKIEDQTVEEQVAKLQSSKANNALGTPEAGKASDGSTDSKAALKPLAELVSFDDFTKMDIRVAKVLAAEAVPKTKKLLKLTLDTGLDTRTVVSGIAEHYTPEAMVGKSVVILANLAPREIKGITSQGMILMAEDPSGKLTVVSPENESVTGAIVK